MLSQQDAVFDAAQRSRDFLDENAAALTGVDLTAARKLLDEVVAGFTTHALDQDVGQRGAKGETAKQRQLRLKLRREQMRPIALIARRNLRDTPQYVSLQMPKPTVYGNAFLASATGMVDAATVHHDTLVAQGLPSTFLDDFKAGLTTLASSLSVREKNRNRRVGATEGLAIQAKNARMVLGVLDALVEKALAGNDVLLRKWRSARLIRRRTGAVNGAATAPAATSTTPAAASTPTAVVAAPSITSTPLPVSESAPTTGTA